MMAMRLGGQIQHKTAVAIGAINLASSAHRQVNAWMTASAIGAFAIQMGGGNGDGFWWG